MIADCVTYTLESNLESVTRVEAEAERFAAQAGFADDELQEITIAVREATINAVLHGNRYDPNKSVQVSFERKPGQLEITVRDQGEGFREEDVLDPSAPENVLKRSGRGILMIRAYMDEVQIRNLVSGTEMVLIKRVRGTAADSRERESHDECQFTPG